MPYRLPDYLEADDRRLLAACQVHTYRASGPGGQKRNKIESAVRIRHTPTGRQATAVESRSQAENRVRALKRLRRELALNERVELDPAAFRPDEVLADCLGPDGNLTVSRRNPLYLRVVQVVLDVLAAVEARAGEAAKLLGLSTGHLIKLLHADEKLWTAANALRRRFGHKPLR